MEKQAAHKKSYTMYASQNDSKWFVITNGQEEIMKGCHLAFLPLPSLSWGQSSSKEDFPSVLSFIKIEALRHNQVRSTGAPMSQMGHLHFKVSLDSRW